MWNNARQLNFTASALAALALLALLAAAGYWAMQRPMFALRALQVDGDVAHISVPVVRSHVVGQLHGNFFTVDLDRARAAFETIPWVRRASVRRVWPNALAVTVQEYVPLGVWGEQQFVSVDGDVFTANQAEASEDLPDFSGPLGSAPQVVARYHDFMKWFAALGATPQSVTLSARYAWSVELSNGMHIELGRERTAKTLEERSQRLIRAWPALTRRWGKEIEYADLRYPNGFALRTASLSQQNNSVQTNAQALKAPNEATVGHHTP